MMSLAEILGPSRDQNQLFFIRIVKNEEIGELARAHMVGWIKYLLIYSDSASKSI